MYDYDDFDELDEREPISEYLTPREVMDLLYIGKIRCTNCSIRGS